MSGYSWSAGSDPEAHIDKTALSHNLGVVRSLVGARTKVMAAVKADAYGHGLLTVARHLALEGVDWLCVASPSEALALGAGPERPGVLVLSPVHQASTLARLAANKIALTVTDHGSINAIAIAQLPFEVEVHLKVDTGMGRLGLPEDATVELAQRIVSLPNVRLGGVFTHFADADGQDPTYTRWQIERFNTALSRLSDAGIEVPLAHAANSAAIVAFPEAHYDMVRAGIMLYGFNASVSIHEKCPPLQPVMRLDAPITFVKQVEPGTRLSYGGLWSAAAPTKIATVRIGYADGYPRQLTGKAWVALRGRPCEVVGRVCMDQILVDVSSVPNVEPGERVVLWGEGGPSVEQLAESIGTISYELLTGLSPRVRRV